MDEKKLKEKLSELFDDNFNAYSDMINLDTQEHIEVPSMTKEMFIETVSKFITKNFKPNLNYYKNYKL